MAFAFSGLFLGHRSLGVPSNQSLDHAPHGADIMSLPRCTKHGAYGIWDMIAGVGFFRFEPQQKQKNEAFLLRNPMAEGAQN